MSEAPDAALFGAIAGNARPLRLFIGIACPCTPAIAALLDDLPKNLEGAAGLRVVPRQNLHITLKFIGAAEANAVPGIVGVMQRALANQRSFELQLQGAGSFQSALWLGVAPNATLNALAANLNEALTPQGFAPETKPFRPHLTLARITRNSPPVGAGLPAIDPPPEGANPKNIKGPPTITTWLKQHHQSHWGKLPVTTVNLYRSDTLADGVRYTVLFTAALSTVQLLPPAP